MFYRKFNVEGRFNCISVTGMPPKELYFLKYNKSGIFKNLIQSESHFRNLEEQKGIPDEKGHANCIVKPE